ncbi:MAG TPA: AsmA-like C-terminal region-containing protein, partial [Burkholderiaceae bacterium]|nr:AsmA-like C-terminal region-containing protein [Burkholderiaceae bacterium]
ALAAVKAQIQLERDRLRAESLSFGLAGGTVRGRFELSGGAPLRVAWRGEADALSIDALAALRGASGYVRGGRVNMRASLDASGRTPRQLAASLDGSALLWANDTALTGSATVMEHNIVVALLQALLPRQEAAQALKIDCAVVNLALHDGVARIDRTIAMETDRVAVAASGELNLAAQTVTLNFQPVVKKGLGLDSSANLAKLVMLEGPLHDPRIGIDVKGTAREAASLGAAVATAGLTLVGKRLLSGPEDTQVCKRAMGQAAR